MSIRRRLMQLAEGQKKRTLITEEMPDWRMTHDPDLLIRAVLIMRETGKMPLPEEVARVPKRWEEEVLQMAYLLRFQEDSIADE